MSVCFHMCVRSPGSASREALRALTCALAQPPSCSATSSKERVCVCVLHVQAFWGVSHLEPEFPFQYLESGGQGCVVGRKE